MRRAAKQTEECCYRFYSDDRLATLASEGNKAAFGALYDRYDRTLLGYCRTIVHNPEDAGDALQNAWMKAMVALRREPPTGPVRPWLFRIVHNEAITVLRRTPPTPERPMGEVATSAGAEEEAVARERVAELMDDLRDLPVGQRAAFVMHELADLDYGEIAIALDTSENNARQLTFAGRSGLEESGAGHDLPCREVRWWLVHADGRRLRTRRLRAHLRTCRDCREFAQQA